MTKIVRILLPVIKLFPLDYEVPSDIELTVGDFVVVPFRSSVMTGIVWQIDIPQQEKFKLKAVIRKFGTGQVHEQMLKFISIVSDYYIEELGSICKMSLPVEIFYKRGSAAQIVQNIPSHFEFLYKLSEDQERALQLLRKSQHASLLKGITGSGKTEVYFHLAAEKLALGKQVLIMLPEIALSTQIISRFSRAFGFSPVVWNSNIGKAEKKSILTGIINGDVRLVIGARSSLFLPYKDLGLIIVDEEHDESYKQDEGVAYNARDMAVLRGHIESFSVVLASATPSIETLYNASSGKYELIELNSRFGDATLPHINLIDMRREKLGCEEWISKTLSGAISTALDKKLQILLFLNRKGYAPLMLCKACGFRYMCSSCSAWLVYHKAKNKLECHHCGHIKYMSNTCPECSEEDSFIACGPGVERIMHEIEDLFPHAKLAMITKETMAKAGDAEVMLNKIMNHEIDIIIGTQIITKGYHFPKLHLVGIIDADLGLGGGDLRATEKTFQLLHQVSGRAGREALKGHVYAQTYLPDNIVIQALKDGDEETFIRYETETRRAANMPPFGRLACLTVSGMHENRIAEFAHLLAKRAPKSHDVVLLGPTSTTIAKLKGKYRYRILVKSQKKFNIQKYIIFWLKNVKVPSWINLKIDIDPYSLL